MTEFHHEDILDNRDESLICPGIGRGFPYLKVDEYEWDPDEGILYLSLSANTELLPMIGIPNQEYYSGDAEIKFDRRGLPISMTFLGERFGGFLRREECTACDISRDVDGAITFVERTLSFSSQDMDCIRHEKVYLLRPEETGLKGTLAVTDMDLVNSHTNDSTYPDGRYLDVVYFPDSEPKDLVVLVCSEGTIWTSRRQDNVIWPIRNHRSRMILDENDEILFDLESFGLEIGMSDGRPKLIGILSREQVQLKRSARTREVLEAQTFIPDEFIRIGPYVVTDLPLGVRSERPNLLRGDIALKRELLVNPPTKIVVSYSEDTGFPRNIQLNSGEGNSGECASADLIFGGIGVASLICTYHHWYKKADNEFTTYLEDRITQRTTILDLGDSYLLLTLTQTDMDKSIGKVPTTLSRMEVITKPNGHDGGFIVTVREDGIRLAPGWIPDSHEVKEGDSLDIEMKEGLNVLRLPDGRTVKVFREDLELFPVED